MIGCPKELWVALLTLSLSPKRLHKSHEAGRGLGCWAETVSCGLVVSRPELVLRGEHGRQGRRQGRHTEPEQPVKLHTPTGCRWWT